LKGSTVSDVLEREIAIWLGRGKRKAQSELAAKQRNFPIHRKSLDSTTKNES
jgi:hypothetical protein